MTMVSWQLFVVLAVLSVHCASCVLVQEEPFGSAELDHDTLDNSEQEQEQVGEQTRAEPARRQGARDKHTDTHRRGNQVVGDTKISTSGRKLSHKKNAESGEKHQVLTCSYDSSTEVGGPGEHEEPEGRFASKDDWKKYGGKTDKARNQETRVASLRKIYNAVPGFFQGSPPGGEVVAHSGCCTRCISRRCDHPLGLRRRHQC